MKRPCWSALTPCPLAKELETVHPRRTYYFLTTTQHQPLPDTGASPLLAMPRRTINISPSLSTASSESVDNDANDRRRELSPSPEVDLSPDFDYGADDDTQHMFLPGSPMSSFASIRHHPHARYSAVGSSRPFSRGNHGSAPSLEGDEREFTQTANGLQQKRKLTGDLLAPTSTPATGPPSSSSPLQHPHHGQAGLLQPPTAAAAPSETYAAVVRDENMGLFLGSLSPSAVVPQPASSPAMRPIAALGLAGGGKGAEAEAWTRLGKFLEWDRSPESIEIEELDGLLLDY